MAIPNLIEDDMNTIAKNRRTDKIPTGHAEPSAPDHERTDEREPNGRQPIGGGR